VTASPGEHAFDVCGPLPKGVTVLEASAGTGKTFTIAALTARYVADGMALEHLLRAQQALGEIEGGPIGQPGEEHLSQTVGDDGVGGCLGNCLPGHGRGNRDQRDCPP